MITIRIVLHVVILSAIGLVSYLCSRGRDGQLFNGVGLLAALSVTRAAIELTWFRSGSVGLYIAALVASPVVAYLAMLPKSSLEEMGGMLFLYFPVASIAADLLFLLPNIILRWRRR